MLSTHEAPVKSVAYSKEHCKSLPSIILVSSSNNLSLYSPPRLRLLGLNPSHPPSYRPYSPIHNHHPPRQTTLPLHLRLQTSRSHDLAPKLHLRALRPHLPRQRHPRRSKRHPSPALATTRILSKIHDARGSMHAERRWLRQ